MKYFFSKFIIFNSGNWVGLQWELLVRKIPAGWVVPLKNDNRMYNNFIREILLCWRHQKKSLISENISALFFQFLIQLDLVL